MEKLFIGIWVIVIPEYILVSSVYEKKKWK